MDIVVLFLISFGIVGSIEARMRVILARRDHQLDVVEEMLIACNKKLDRLLIEGDSSPAETEKL